MPLLYPNLVEATRHSVGSWLDKNIIDEQLKLELAAHVLYFADDPYTLSMFYFGLPQSSFIGSGGHFIQGGSQKLSDHLASFITNNGGTVLLGKKAEKLITKNGMVTGVSFRDNYNNKSELTTIECDNVVANCAIPLVPDMLDEPHAGKLRQKIKDKSISCSLLSLYLGFNTDVSKFGVEHYSNEFLGTGVNTIKDIHPNQLTDWSKRSFVFVDYGKVDAQLAPRGKSVGSICAVDYLRNWVDLNDEEYKAKKEEVIEQLLQRLEKQFPGIRSSIEYAELSTPKTIQRFTLNPEGTPYGYTQSRQQVASKRFRNNFLIPNLYFASAWAFPGGGFEGTVMAGFLAALQMNKDKIWGDIDSTKFKDNRIVKLTSIEKIDDETIEVHVERPVGIKYDQGAHAILQLLEPKVTELDLPYRWLPVSNTTDDSELTFKIKLEDNSFSKSCTLLEIGDKAIVYGPMA